MLSTLQRNGRAFFLSSQSPYGSHRPLRIGGEGVYTAISRKIVAQERKTVRYNIDWLCVQRLFAFA